MVKERATHVYSDEDIKRAIQLYEGDSIPGFPSIDAFLYLLTPVLEKLKEPAHETLMEVYQILEEACLKILDKLLEKTP